MRTTSKIALALAGSAGAGVLAGRRAVDQWAANHDPTDGRPAEGPEGDEVTVTSRDGAQLVGTDAGSGPPVILVHGYTGTETHYAPVARRLVESGHRVITVDQRGHGRSGIGDSGFTIEALGEDVAAWVTGLDLTDVVVSGHSMGGMAVMSFAVHHLELAAERVKGYVLVATRALAGSGTPFDGAAARIIQQDRYHRVVRHPFLGRLAMSRVVGAKPALAHIDAARETYLATHPDTRIGAALMIFESELRPKLPTVNRPTSIIVGSRDNLVQPKWNHEIAGLIPGATITEVPDAGHMLPWERPELVTDLIVQAHKPA